MSLNDFNLHAWKQQKMEDLVIREGNRISREEGINYEKIETIKNMLKKNYDIKEISDLQFQILDNCCRYLKSGGELIYSTCSILKEENENIINRFLEINGDFEIEKDEKNKIKFFEKYYAENRIF